VNDRHGDARIRILSIGLTLWAAPVAIRRESCSDDRTCSSMRGLFFSGAAVVTFGGAYAVLSYNRATRRSTCTTGLPAGGDGQRPRPRRNYARTAHHGRRVRSGSSARYRHPGELNPWVAGRPWRHASSSGSRSCRCFVFVFLGAPQHRGAAAQTSESPPPSPALPPRSLGSSPTSRCSSRSTPLFSENPKTTERADRHQLDPVWQHPSARGALAINPRLAFVLVFRYKLSVPPRPRHLRARRCGVAYLVTH